MWVFFLKLTSHLVAVAATLELDVDDAVRADDVDAAIAAVVVFAVDEVDEVLMNVLSNCRDLLSS